MGVSTSANKGSSGAIAFARTDGSFSLSISSSSPILSAIRWSSSGPLMVLRQSSVALSINAQASYSALAARYSRISFSLIPAIDRSAQTSTREAATRNRSASSRCLSRACEEAFAQVREKEYTLDIISSVVSRSVCDSGLACVSSERFELKTMPVSLCEAA